MKPTHMDVLYELAQTMIHQIASEVARGKDLRLTCCFASKSLSMFMEWKTAPAGSKQAKQKLAHFKDFVRSWPEHNGDPDMLRTLTTKAVSHLVGQLMDNLRNPPLN